MHSSRRWKQQENVAALFGEEIFRESETFFQGASTACYSNKKKQRPKNFGAKMTVQAQSSSRPIEEETQTVCG